MRVIRALLTFVLLSILALPAVFLAAPRLALAQTGLRPFTPFTGEISLPSPYQIMTFPALQGQHWSLRMLATAGELTPFLELYSPTGELVATSTVTSFRNATIEAFEAPITGLYSLRVASNPARFTAGSYSIILLPGFSYLYANLTFSGESPLRVFREGSTSSQIRSGQHRLQVTNRLAWMGADRLGSLKDLYVRIDLDLEAANGYWEAGLLVRGPLGGGALDGHMLLVNSSRQWRLVRAGAGTIFGITDWAALPTDPAQPEPLPATLGLLARDDQFTVYYNETLLGVFADSAGRSEGAVGVMLATAQMPGVSAAVLFDNLQITLPVDLPSGAASDPVEIVPPLQLEGWNGNAAEVLAALKAAQLVPGIGEIGFAINEAFVSNNTAGGIIYVPLARAERFADIVYTADVAWNANSFDVACGLEFRAVDDQLFTIAYIDRKGGYGLRQQGESLPVIYDLSKAVLTADGAINRMTVIAIGSGLVMYVNGQRVAYLNGIQRSGNTFVVAYNYAPAANACLFTNIWLRHFDW